MTFRRVAMKTQTGTKVNPIAFAIAGAILLSVLLCLSISAAADACSITSGGFCSGTCKKGEICDFDKDANGNKEFSCSCQPTTKAILGKFTDAAGGTISFNGSTITITGLTISDVIDKGTWNSISDPIVGASRSEERRVGEDGRCPWPSS